GVGDVVLDLLEGSRRQEAGRRHRKDVFPCGGQTGGYADQVLLRDAHLDELSGQRFGERSQLARPARIARQHQQVAVLAGELQQGGGEFVEIWSSEFHQAVTFSNSVRASSSSASAWANCSSVGTL